MAEIEQTTADVDALRATLERMLAYLSQQQERSARAPSATSNELEELRAENAALRAFVQRFGAEVAVRVPHFTGLAELRTALEEIGSSL